MGIFSNPKCPIHKKPYKVGKDEMCQQYYYCYDCSIEASRKRAIDERIAKLEKRIYQLEKIKPNE